jgi:hypothetical protein
VSVAYFPGSIWNPYAANYQAGGRAHHARNWRYVNVREFDALREDGYRSTDIKKALYYDRLESRDFPKALEDLSKGVFGALLSWPENPGLVSHSKALERLFLHLDMKLEVKLAYAEKASQAERMAYGQSLVRELLAKLVEQINIEGDQYLVRFKLNNGKRSPWVIMPVVFKTSGYGSVPSYKRGASYYQGPYEVFDASTASRN